MIMLTQLCPSPGEKHLGDLILPYAIRQKCRFLAELETGMEVGVLMERGTVLQDGDILANDQGQSVTVISAPEAISQLSCDDALLLARAAYHLGNRHVPLQISAGQLSYQRDHVLDDMLHGLGLKVRHLEAAFEPEPGAYGSTGGHGHSHSHD